MNTTQKFPTLMLPLALACALAACNRPDPPMDAAATPPVDDTVAADDAMPTQSPDAMGNNMDMDDNMAAAPDMADAGTSATSQSEALALLVAVDQHEIAAAEQARTKDVDGDELAFAELMITEHTKNLADTRALASDLPADSAQVAQLRAKGKAELDMLAATEGDAYEDAYIDAMVTGHTEVLAMLDNQLIPAAQDDAVAKHFNMTREHVAMHLEKAKALQD